MVETTGRRGRRWKQLLDGHKETIGYMKHYIALCREITLEMTMDLSCDRLWKESINHVMGERETVKWVLKI